MRTGRFTTKQGALRARRSALAVVAAAVVTVTGCVPQMTVTYDSSSPTAHRTSVLTTDGGDRYTFSSTAGAMDAAALPTNTSGNLRTLFWPASVPVVADSQTCAVWSSQSGALVQQGAALRIRESSTGRVRAITVTKNIIYGATWIFNFHTWDSARTGVFQIFGQQRISALVDAAGTVAPLPWNFCARVIGSVIEFKVWTNTMTEPAWGDPARGGRAIIPAGWETAGTTGWYLGHLEASDTARFDNLRTWRYDAPSVTRTGTSSTTSTEPTPTTVVPDDGGGSVVVEGEAA